VRVQVLTAASMKTRVLLYTALCSPVGIHRSLRGAYCLHHQSDHSNDNAFCIHIYTFFLCSSKEPGSSGSIVSDYGLDDRAIGVRSQARAEDFSSILCVQTGSGAHPASCTMGTGDPFPGSKERPGRDADHSPPSSAEVVNE
jgi:hypothetical protein